MRVLLVDPHYVGQQNRTLQEVSGVLPALGLLSVAAVLRRDGHEVKILDCQFHDLDGALGEIRHSAADLVAMGTTSTWIRKAHLLACEAKRRGAIVVLGGPEATVNPKECLSTGDVDLVTDGESEDTMRELCQAIEAGRDWSGVSGIQYLREGALHHTGQRAVLPDLDSLPMHAWDLLPVNRYFVGSVTRTCKESIGLVTSRGCPWKCSFCSQTVFGRRLRTRSPRLIIEEMRHLHDKYGKRDFALMDDVFTVPRKKVEEFCSLLIKEGMDVKWCCATRADLLDRPLLTLMKASGCYEISFGVESGSQEMLDHLKKQLPLSTVWRASRLMREVGLRSKAYFMIGLPGETPEQVRQTLRLAETLPLDFPLIIFYNPVRGTGSYEEAMTRGKVLGNEGSDSLGRLRILNYVPDSLDETFLLQMYRRAYRRIYWHPKRVLRYFLRYTHSFDDLRKGFSSARQILQLQAQ